MHQAPATNALVFGKFLPFHRGHEALIRFALEHCNHLTVVICVSNRETIPGWKRKEWIHGSFVGTRNLSLMIYHYDAAELPNQSASSEEVSRQWANVFRELVPDVNLVVTSEPYGDFVAGFMNIRHLLFDQSRQLYPVSATVIMDNLPANWSFLPAQVKPDFSYKVVVLGTESTGKSTLTQRLVTRFGCTAVSEAGRDLIADSNEFSFEDLNRVATAHATAIENAVTGDHPLIIIDTDIHITISYGLFFYGERLKPDEWIMQANRADLYLYLGADAEYVQDGTRLCQSERDLLDASHRQTLTDYGIQFVEICGDWEERFRESVRLIENKMLDVKQKTVRRS